LEDLLHIKQTFFMKLLRMTALSGCILLFAGMVRGQDEWPRTLNASDGSIIRIYEPTPESFKGNILKGRAAFSISRAGDTTEPMFGTFWAVATVETDKDSRVVHVLSVKIPNLKFARDSDAGKASYLQTELEAGIPKLNLNLSLDVLLASLDLSTEEKSLSKGLNTAPPKIIYQSQPSLLVLIDGQPMLQKNKDWDLDVVVNTPYTIVKDDKHYYLYGATHWYVATEATGPYSDAGKVPSKLEKVQKSVDDANSANAGYIDSTAAADTLISNIIVSTEPAELIQTNGNPVWATVTGTGLSYVTNSNNDIFRAADGQYYVLLSGRWYKSTQLQSGWQYVASDALPPDFAKIPEGSPKDNVLASVAGTQAAREAILDAQIPQTARVDRKNTQASVSYDGKPQFDNIPGTQMQYAVNSPQPVIQYKGLYYCVDNGVWFQSTDADGPWQVCTVRPDEVDLIPPGCPVYNVKYVYIYDNDPDYVYMGYTPGYLNNYIYGPTVVYGTGFYYTPWRGHFFYPRPWTWGFDMWYDPWMGWTFGYDYDWDWFNWGFGFGLGFGFGGWWGGWWGPMAYRPPFVGRGFAHGGFYGRGSNFPGNRMFHNNNIYQDRQGIFNRGGSGRVMTDRDGNIYRRDGQGGWQQRQNGNWRSVGNTATRQNLERQDQMHTRGMMRRQNFQQARGGFGGFRGGSFGGFRGGGFGGGFHGGGGRR
jgi:hypothetical protein